MVIDGTRPTIDMIAPRNREKHHRLEQVARATGIAT
jgi:hypothetical protein